MGNICYYKGKFMPSSECCIPVTDMAIQRGIGTFESIRIYNGRPFALSKHMERFAQSVEGAGIDGSKITGQLESIIREGLKRPDCPKEGLAKPFATGGDVNNRGLFPEPRFFVIFEELHPSPAEDYTNGAVLIPNKIDRPYPLIKSINYLMAFIPLAHAPADVLESLYITPEGDITEAMTSNFFLCAGGKIITAPVGRVLKGVTRSVILTLAQENGFKVEERCPKESELAQADEAFVSGSVKEVLPIVRIGSQKIGTGRPGPVALRLQQLYTANLDRWME
jgi:branched-subunit amino acid aminotransferase/4-amino-4-deoxychorismate lyase